MNIRDRRFYTNIHELEFLHVGHHYNYLHEASGAEMSGTLEEMFVARQDEDDVWFTFISDADGNRYDYSIDDIQFEENEEAAEALEELQLVVKFVKSHPNAQLPVYSTEGSSGMDFFAVDDTVEIHPGGSALLSTGLNIELPVGYELQLRSRSSWRKRGLLGADVGTIDSDYRGIPGFIYWNVSRESIMVFKGDKIGQGVLAPVFQAKPVLVDSISESARGQGGWGSTGR